MARPPRANQKKYEVNAYNASIWAANAIDYKICGKELENVLEVIEVTAKEGKKELNWYASLHERTIEKLVERGFIIFNSTPNVITKTNLYHSIHW